MKKILFLGYNKNKTSLIEKINTNNKKWLIKQTNEKINLQTAKKFDSIICFGYRHIIDKKIINSLKKPIINLHISYLPYNRGNHPNFWSFVENTPSGITISEVNNGIDTGNIIYQKIIDFKLLENKKTLTFSKTYKTLFSEMERLFLINMTNIINHNFNSSRQVGKGTFRNEKDLPVLLKSWNQNIYKTVLKYDNIKRQELKKRLLILDKIESTRKNNNINWMNIVRTSLKNSSQNTLNILEKINTDDNSITKLFKDLIK